MMGKRAQTCMYTYGRCLGTLAEGLVVDCPCISKYHVYVVYVVGLCIYAVTWTFSADSVPTISVAK